MTRRPRVRALLALLTALPATFAHAAVDLTDDAGHQLHLERPAQRIVSLAPHVTELLFAAGAGSKVVGVVQHSDYPPEATRLPQVGSHTRVDLEAVAALKPDLVIAWKSGNRDTQLDRFSALGIPVYVNEPRSLEAVAQSLEQFGRLAATEAAANAAAAGFRQRQSALAARYRERPPVRLFYQIWNAPLMTINDEQVISDAIRLCGGVNVFGGLKQLAPRISTEAVLAANPE
ncbi:MAG: cobalamin-binding protein, partial [Proteobacteria bacterium]|nr:cobalamin-binding protein [Pseudomonadota bacterium]